MTLIQQYLHLNFARGLHQNLGGGALADAILDRIIANIFDSY